MTVHQFDLLRSVFGEPELVYARSANLLHPERDCDDCNTVVVDFEGGATATLHESSIGPMPNVGGMFICDEGVVTYTCGGESLVRHQRYDVEDPTEFTVAEGFLTGVAAENELFARWVLEDEEPEITGRDGRQAIAMVEAAYESAATNEPVRVS